MLGVGGRRADRVTLPACVFDLVEHGGDVTATGGARHRLTSDHELGTSARRPRPVSSLERAARLPASVRASRSRPRPLRSRRRTPRSSAASISGRLLPSERSSQKRAPVGLSEKIRFVFRWTSTTSSPSRRETTSGLGREETGRVAGRIGWCAIHVSYLLRASCLHGHRAVMLLIAVHLVQSADRALRGILRGDEGETRDGRAALVGAGRRAGA